MGDKDDATIGTRTRPAIGGPLRPFDWKRFLEWSAGITVPLATGKLHGGSCGPGGLSSIVDSTDLACYEHDACYAAAGVNGIARFVDAGPLRLDVDQRESVQGCDEGLCEDLAKVEPASYKEAVDRALIQAIFSCGLGAPDRNSLER